MINRLQIFTTLFIIAIPLSLFSQIYYDFNHHFKHPQTYTRNVEETQELIQQYDYENTSGNIQYSLFLIGDSGRADSLPYLLNTISSDAKSLSQKSSIVFLGDNIYQNGLPNEGKKDYEEALYRLTVQIDAFEDYTGPAYFIPGNHDYHKINKFIGRKRVKNQARVIENYENIHFVPAIDSRKAVGLVEIDYADKRIGLVILDIEWYMYHGYWLHVGWRIKNKRFWKPLEEILSRNDFDHWVVATHHPIRSVALHGVEKSLYSKVDLQKSKYRKLIRRLEDRFAEANPDHLIYTAGHDHTLQLFVEPPLYHLLSGSGSKKTYILEEELESSEIDSLITDVNYLESLGIKKAEEYARSVMFADNANGYSRVDFHEDGSVWVTFIGFPYSEEPKKLYIQKLY